MRTENTKRMIWAGLFAALTAVATMVIRVPSPTGGYINPGDAMVILAAFLLGPGWGAAAAGLGSALADLISGYIIYAPATFVIKAAMALAAGGFLRKAKAKHSFGSAVLGAVTAELIMIAGYFAFTALVLGFGWGAVAEIPGNIVQGIFGAFAGTSLYIALLRIPYVKNNF